MYRMLLPLDALGSHTQGASLMARDGGSRAILPGAGLATVPGLVFVNKSNNSLHEIGRPRRCLSCG